VAIFETVGDRLRRRVNTEFDPFLSVRLNAFGKGCAREAFHAQTRIVEPCASRSTGRASPIRSIIRRAGSLMVAPMARQVYKTSGFMHKPRRLGANQRSCFAPGLGWPPPAVTAANNQGNKRRHLQTNA